MVTYFLSLKNVVVESLWEYCKDIFIPQFINLLFLMLAHMGTCKIKACRYYLGQNKLCDPLILLHIEEKT